jgi:hypothetical protein
VQYALSSLCMANLLIADIVTWHLQVRIRRLEKMIE